MKPNRVIKILDEVLSHYVPDGNPEVWRAKILQIKEREEKPKKKPKEKPKEGKKKKPSSKSHCGVDTIGAWCISCRNQLDCELAIEGKKNRIW